MYTPGFPGIFFLRSVRTRTLIRHKHNEGGKQNETIRKDDDDEKSDSHV